jgi:hypothetical protein
MTYARNVEDLKEAGARGRGREGQTSRVREGMTAILNMHKMSAGYI